MQSPPYIKTSHLYSKWSTCNDILIHIRADFILGLLPTFFWNINNKIKILKHTHYYYQTSMNPRRAWPSEPRWQSVAATCPKLHSHKDHIIHHISYTFFGFCCPAWSLSWRRSAWKARPECQYYRMLWLHSLFISHPSSTEPDKAQCVSVSRWEVKPEWVYDSMSAPQNVAKNVHMHLRVNCASRCKMCP